MGLRLNGSTSGYTEVNAPAVAGSNTLVLPTGNGSANQLLKNGSTAGSLAWSNATENSSGDFAFNSGYGSAATAYGCRAWVNFNGTTASPSTIRASGNVSSVTKNGTGDYTVNFTTALADANYSVSGSGGVTSESVPLSGISFGINSLAAGSFRFQTRRATTNADLAQVFLSVFR